MLARFVNWYVSSPNPEVVRVRDYVRRHPQLRRLARALLFAIGAAATPRRLLVRRPIGPKARAVAEARAVGGGITVAELERLWGATRWGVRALCIGGASELKQMEAVLRCRRAGSIALCSTPAGAWRELARRTRFGLIAVTSDADLTNIEQELRDRAAKTSILRLKVPPSMTSPYVRRTTRSARAAPDRSARKLLREKLLDGDPVRIAVLNDIGFRYGAGVALRRQAASFLLNGWEVAVAAWAPGRNVTPPSVTGIDGFDNWRGVQALEEIHADAHLSDAEIIAKLTGVVRSMHPDVVIVENIHGAGWPIGILPAIRKLGALTLVYMHDCYWVTGRCAHAGPCELFLTGCNETCPTADLYPRLARDRIAQAWRDRAEIFTGPEAIPLIGNSRWMRDFAVRRFGDKARTSVVHLGLDHHLFAPIPKDAARRLLGLPQDKTVVLMGAVSIRDPYKGGPLFQGLHQALLARDDVALALFGHESEQLACARFFGLVEDERLMPLIYSAADIFVSTATAESFGQTLLEAHACEVPAVALNVGGVGDVVVHGESGLLVDRQVPAELIAAVEKLIADKAARRRMGEAGRARVERHFTLNHQADAWIDCLKSLC